MAFFESPAKAWLVKELKTRNHPTLQRTTSQETIGQPLLGLPSDPMRDVDEAVREVREEVEARRRRGASVSMPVGQDLKAVVEDKLGREI